MRPRLGSIALFSFVLSGTLLSFAGRSIAAGDLDATHRTAVMSAYLPEWKELQAALKNRKSQIVNGTEFVTGEIESKPVLLFLSGISMVNAAMTAQFVLDQFTIDRIVFSGVAGGLNPNLRVGDVVVPERWSEYLEAIFARSTGAGYKLPKSAAKPQNANYGWIFPQPVQIARAPDKPEDRVWFTVDPGLMALVRTISDKVELSKCASDRKCVDYQPKVIVGGNGVSGQAFVDNSNFRDYAHNAFKADAVDQETAAVAHVAYANRVPFIAFRTLSDLAGGEASESLFDGFQDLAARNSALLVRALLKALP